MNTGDRPLQGSDIHQYAAKLLQETRDELAKADQKAATVLAVVGVAAAIVVGASVQGSVKIDSLPTALRAGVGLLAAVQAWALFQLGSAVFPRVGKASPGTLEYFGDVDDDRSERELRADLEKAAVDPIGRDLRQFAILAKIVQSKYRRVKRGLIGSGLAAGVLGFAVLWPRICG